VPVKDNSLRDPSATAVEPAPTTVSQPSGDAPVSETTVSQPSGDAPVSETIVAAPSQAASTPVQQVGAPATQTDASATTAATSNTAPTSTDVTAESTSTEPATERLDDKGEHLLAGFDRTIAQAQTICENLLNEFNAIGDDLKELRASKGKFEDRQKQLQSISNHWMLKLNTAKSVGMEMKAWAPKKKLDG
jgi:hypothetical protein